MDKIRRRTLKKDLQKKSFAMKDSDAGMVAILVDNTQTLQTVQKWPSEFRRERDIFKDDPRSRRLATATVEENIDHFPDMMMNQRQLVINVIANAINLFHEIIENITSNELNMTKASARWVKRLLTPDKNSTGNSDIV